MHGLAMWFAWGFLGFIQILSNRYLSKYWKISMLMHRVSATLLLITTLSSSVYVISSNDWKINFNTHGILGAISTTCALFISIGGFTGLTLL